MDDRITVGHVLKPQGIRGEIKIKPCLDDGAMLLDLEQIYLNGKPMRILGGRADAEAVYLALRGVADRNAAELLRGAVVEADRDDLPLDEGRYFIVDVLGCEVVTTAGRVIGTVKDITPAPCDIYTVSAPSGEFMFPLAPGVLVDVDLENKKVVVDDARFREVSEYAD